MLFRGYTVATNVRSEHLATKPTVTSRSIIAMSSGGIVDSEFPTNCMRRSPSIREQREDLRVMFDYFNPEYACCHFVIRYERVQWRVSMYTMPQNRKNPPTRMTPQRIRVLNTSEIPVKNRLTAKITSPSSK